MHHIKTGITAREIMDKNFPIIDSSLPLIKCVKKMNNKHEACLVIKNGNFLGILGYDDILRGFMYNKNKEIKIKDIAIRKNNFAVVKPYNDVYNTLLLMKKNNIDFVLVKEKNNFFGLITKKEIADVEPLLFENLTSENIASN